MKDYRVAWLDSRDWLNFGFEDSKECAKYAYKHIKSSSVALLHKDKIILQRGKRITQAEIDKEFKRLSPGHK